MRKFFLFKKRIWKQFVSVSLAALVLVSVLGTSFGLEVPRAQAQLSVLKVGSTDPSDLGKWWDQLVNTIEDTINTVATKALEYKAFSLDTIAWNIAKLAVAQIQKETVRWINSGFQGSPAFVQDIGGFLQDSADKVAGEFIYGSELKALCSPFYLNIKIALSIKMQKQSPVRCTLSKVVGNVENFLGGDFASGGLPGWFEMTVNPNNNFFGASASAQNSLVEALNKRKEYDLNVLNWGKGFLEKQECDEVDDPFARAQATEYGDEAAGTTGSSGAKKYTKKINCKTVTPGGTIGASLDKTLGLGADTLVTADQFNEVVSALFQQLAVQVLTGARGLLGTSDSGGNGKPSYLDQINNPQYDSFPGQNTIETHFIDTAITDESAFRALYANIVSKADALFARIAQLEALDGTETPDGRWECGSFEGIRAQTTAIRDPAFVIQTKSDKNLATLNNLNTRWKTTRRNAQYSTASAEENLRLSETFLDLQSGNQLHRASSIPEHKRATDPVVAQLGTLASQAETICRFIPKPTAGGSGGSGDGE